MRLFILFAVSFFTWMPPALSTENRCVIMLYGLGRSTNTLWTAEQFFAARDYEVYRLTYPSTKKDLDQLGEQIRKEAQGLCPTTLNFLTNSMGGICLLYTSPSPRDLSTSRMPSSA